LHITATQNSDAEMRRRCPSEQASKQASKHPPPPKKPIERNVPTRRKRAANVPEASSLFFERDRWIQTVGEETEFTSLCLCVWLFGEKAQAQAQAQAQALSLTPISTMEKTDSPVVVVVVHAHTLSSKQDCVELRKLAAPFIHSFLVGLPWSSTAIQLPTKCPTKSQKRRGRGRRKKSHTHTHKHTQRTRGGDNGSSTDNQTRGNQSIRLILPVNCKKQFSQFNKNQTCNNPLQTQIHNSTTTDLKPEIKRDPINPSKTQVSPSDEKTAPAPPLHQPKKKTSCKGLNFRYKKEAARERANRSVVVIFLARSSSRCSLLLLLFFFFFVRIFAKRASERARIGEAEKQQKSSSSGLEDGPRCLPCLAHPL
jgi:hypothetical protein